MSRASDSVSAHTGMKWVAYARDADELGQLGHRRVSEVILGLRGLSRLGRLDLKTLHELAALARDLDVRPILEWDILMTPPDFVRAVSDLGQVDLKLFAAIRVQDPGAYQYVLQNHPGIAIQLILETGNHNLESVQRWCSYGGKRLERVVLSLQLPKAKLAEMIGALTVPVEVLGLGPILLLYTPRHLLSNQVGDWQWLKDETGANQHLVTAMASSEESHHSGFRIVENHHGTFLFHAKDYCLVDQLDHFVKTVWGRCVWISG